LCFRLRYPDALDILDLDDSGHPETVDITARLLATAMAEVIPEGTQPPYYLRFVDPGWREAPATRQPTEDRIPAAAQTGARLFVERLRLSPAGAGAGRRRPAGAGRRPGAHRAAGTTPSARHPPARRQCLP
jgi:hypothetical protein